MVNNKWLSCKLEGKEDYFTNSYLSLPYEIDANNYARDKAIYIYPSLKNEIFNLYNKFLPKEVNKDLESLFKIIDNNM